MKRLLCNALCCSLFFALSQFSMAENSESLARKLSPLIEKHRGDVAVSVKHLGNGEQYNHRSDATMPTASLIKVAVMIEAYRQAAAGTIDLEEYVELGESDMVPGSGILTKHFSPGTRLSLCDAVRLMMSHSDNTATNLVLGKTGLRQVGEAMEQLACPNTRINALVFRRDTSIAPDRSRQYGLGTTTSAEMLSLLERIHGKSIVSETASTAMMGHLLSCEDDSKLASSLPEGVKLAHKTGAVTRARCDAGLLMTKEGVIAICVLTANNEDRSWTTNNAANRLCGKLAETVVVHYSKPVKQSLQPIELSEGAGGGVVEDLQRTLNKRLPAELSVDGDFGPATKAAVERWQRKKELLATGIVDKKTWESLGPIVTKDPPPPPPSVINAEKLPTAAADALDGPPFVTCKAWAIIDRDTGEAVAAHRASQRLDFASTTKIMTAYVVLKWVAEHPDVLDEELVFSARADQTRGSTSGIRAGEKLSVRELLYGLMLPSGNDASVALAEHFGAKLMADKKGGKQEPLERFIDHMNETASELGMQDTRFKNPHGLTANGHLSTVNDLALLARAAMKLPRFRCYVSTRQHGCTLQSVSGYSRNVVWKNTNQLLRRAGFEGVKTGTTSAAGACLVSAGSRDGRRLIVVVLGASSSPGRYVDTRNLYRWAWRTAEKKR